MTPLIVVIDEVDNGWLHNAIIVTYKFQSNLMTISKWEGTYRLQKSIMFNGILPLNGVSGDYTHYPYNL